MVGKKAGTFIIKMSIRLLIPFLFISLLVFSVGNTATKKISGTTNMEDTHIFSNYPNGQYGGRDDLDVVTNYGVTNIYARILIRVKNVALELGANATNITAVCSLRCNVNNIDDNIYAYRVFKPWVEGTLTGITCTGTGNGATWNDWNCLDLEWGIAGCANASDAGSENSGDGTDYDRKATAESNVNVTTSSTWYSWSISTELATGWYNGTIEERGIILVGTITDGESFFNSTEHPTTSYHPFFVFTYTLPPGSMRLPGDWRFKTSFNMDWRFQDGEIPTVPEIQRIFDNGQIAKIFNNGEIWKVFH